MTQSRTLPLSAGAFTPNEEDTDGLSLYLEAELSIEELLAASPRPADQYVVVRLKASDIYSLGLTLARTDYPGDLPGHVVIPEINRQDYEDRQKKPRLKEYGKVLVDLARKHIVTPK